MSKVIHIAAMVSHAVYLAAAAWHGTGVYAVAAGTLLGTVILGAFLGEEV